MTSGTPQVVAVIGAGIGAEHVTAYLALPERFRVGAICDLDATRARTLADRAPGAAALTDLDQVLADPIIDIVDVCLPPSLHAEVASRAADAGKHVVCEKPLAASLQQVDRLIAGAERAGRVLAPVFQYPYGPGFARLERLLDQGIAGRALAASVETHWDRDNDYFAVPWRGTRAGELGGAVLSHAIHAHDLLCRAFGPVRRVTALTATRVNDVEVEDCAALAFEHTDGALATSSITLGGAGNVTRLRLCYEHLTAESGLEPYRPASGAWTFTARDPARQGAIDAVVDQVGAVPEGFVGFLVELDRALREPECAAGLAGAGRRSIELATAIYRAARDGAAVSLPLSPDDADYGGWY